MATIKSGNKLDLDQKTYRSCKSGTDVLNLNSWNQHDLLYKFVKIELSIWQQHQKILRSFTRQERKSITPLQTKKAIPSQMARIPRLRQYLGIRKGLTLPRTPGRVPTLKRVTHELYKPLQTSFKVPIFRYQPLSPHLSNIFSSLPSYSHACVSHHDQEQAWWT